MLLPRHYLKYLLHYSRKYAIIDTKGSMYQTFGAAKADAV